MTTGILKSINVKDKLYKVLKQTSKESPNYADIQTNFKTYRNIFRRSIMFAKRDFYQRMFLFFLFANRHITFYIYIRFLFYE